MPEASFPVGILVILVLGVVWIKIFHDWWTRSG